MDLVSAFGKRIWGKDIWSEILRDEQRLSKSVCVVGGQRDRMDVAAWMKAWSEKENG